MVAEEAYQRQLAKKLGIKGSKAKQISKSHQPAGVADHGGKRCNMFSLMSDC